LEGQKNRLVKTLWRLSAKTFIPAGFCQLATVLCQVSIPLLVRELLKVLDANPGQNVIREGMPFAVGIFLASFCNAVANHRHRHLATKTGIVMRSAVNGVIYERVLRLTPRGKTGLTSGEVSTLVAIDTQKVRQNKSVVEMRVDCHVELHSFMYSMYLV
jgi:ABC-type multidrug transport system fused ATPase/permease subunit